MVRGGKVTRLELPGPVLGFVPTASFEQGFEVLTFSLESNDLLLLHTDGLEDLEDRTGEKFGADRVAAVLKSCAGLEPKKIVGAMMHEADQFSDVGSREGDVTVICLKVR
jgi:serine phosphatase RsbU (regulator of sigma subunit)